MAIYSRAAAEKENADRVWWIDFYFQQKRYRQKIGSRKKDAINALADIKVQIATGKFIPPDKRQCQILSNPGHVLFSTFATEDFLNWSKVHHSASHHDRLRRIINKHLIPYFDGCYLDEISYKQIEDYIITRQKSGYKRGKRAKPIKNTTINREICCIKIIFRKAVEREYLEKSPAKKVKALKEIPNPPRLLEKDEISRLREEVPKRLKAMVACGFFAGLRSGELFHLQWNDCNFKTEELTVVSRQDHQTKNNKSRRIPMNDFLVEALRNHERTTSPYVFPNEEGSPYRDIRNALKSAAERAGIEGGITMHQLRHAFCSHALMQGIDPRTVQKWMGHQSLNTTLLYAHISPDHEKDAIKKLKF
jgi:integrase